MELLASFLFHPSQAGIEPLTDVSQPPYLPLGHFGLRYIFPHPYVVLDWLSDKYDE